jgi:ethanolamine permease
MTELKKVLGPIHIWAIAVGLVISGDYFGWNYGLKQGGPLGMIIATLLVTLMYVCFIFSYTELSAAIPHAGGPFAYARRAFGDRMGFIAGFCTLVEFLFAPPAIARAIGSYVNFRVPSLGVTSVALGAFVVFCLINALGVTLAATFELIVTAAAAFELFLFFFLTTPHVELSRITSVPFGALGVFAAIPFAIWFYLGMEGVAMSAEEVRNPKRDIPRGYVAGILTLVVLALGTLICTTGVLPLDQLVFDDSPLPRTLAAVLSKDHPMTHLMVYLGLFGLIASFHGIIMGCSRQVFALAREGYLPRAIGALHPKLKTPVWAVVMSGVIGSLLVLTEKTDDLISIAVLGAIGVYIVSMVSMLALRRREPGLERPFRAPFYPVFPVIALALAVVCLLAAVYGSPWYVTTAFAALFVFAFAVWTARSASR